MSFTLKHIFLAEPVADGRSGNRVTHVYSVSRYMHETLGEGSSDPGVPSPDLRGPLITMYDERGAHAGILKLHPGHSLYVENDRGKTVEHYLGDEWRSPSR